MGMLATVNRAPGFKHSCLSTCAAQAGTVIWIGILVYTDPAGLRTYLTSQVTEQSPLGEAGLPPMPVPGGVLPAGDAKIDLSVFPADPVPLSENQTQQREQKAGLESLDQLEEDAWAQGAENRGNGQPELGTAAEVTWGAEDEEIWRKLSFRHWPALFSYYNITLAKRQVAGSVGAAALCMPHRAQQAGLSPPSLPPSGQTNQGPGQMDQRRRIAWAWGHGDLPRAMALGVLPALTLQ